MQEEKLSEGCDLTHPCRKDTWFRIVVSSMPRTGTTARTSTINRSTRPVLALDVSSYSRDLENWPRSWMGWDKDLPRDEGLVAGCRPFFQHVAAGGLSRKTIRRHLDNRWRAGGETIRDLHYGSSQRKHIAERLLQGAIRGDGGTLLHNGSEEAQHPFASTSRKLHRFLSPWTVWRRNEGKPSLLVSCPGNT